uniref:Uncharacterized protein n=1 Tax=viral metagenome TaxID=1070528 RepID=A0A6M3KTI1_9ZZZZ
MTMDWWTTKKDEWDVEAAKAAQRAYYDTFLRNEHSQKVLAHLRLIAKDGVSNDMILTQIAFVDEIRRLCGPEDELGRIRAEADTAARGHEPSEPLTAAAMFRLDGFRNDDTGENNGV